MLRLEKSGDFTINTGKIRTNYLEIENIYWKSQGNLSACNSETRQIWYHTLNKKRTLKNTGKLRKILEKSGNLAVWKGGNLAVIVIILRRISLILHCVYRGVQAFGTMPPVTYPGLNLAKIPVMDEAGMEVDLDSPDAGIAPMGSLHRAYQPMGLFSPGQYGNLMIDPGTLPFGNVRNVSPIISPCRTPTIMGSAGSSPDMDSRQDAQSAEDPHYIHYNQLSSSPEDDSLHVNQHVSYSNYCTQICSAKNIQNTVVFCSKINQ